MKAKGSYHLERKTYSAGYRPVGGSYESIVAARKAAIKYFDYETRLIGITGGGRFLGVHPSGKPMYEGQTVGTIKRGDTGYIWCDYNKGMKLSILNKDGTLGRACPEYKKIWNQLD